MRHLKQIVDWVVKNWGYEYLLVAAGAFVGLLLVIAVGSKDDPVVTPAAPKVRVAPAPPPVAKARQAPQTIETQAAAENTIPRPDPKPPASTAADAPAKDAPAWRRFAAIHGPVLGRPMIAVLIDDMGVDRSRSARALQLPGPLTMSFLTYARSVKAQAEAARAAGHEIMIHVPMEADNADAYPGPKALISNLSPSELRRRVKWALGRLDNYVGINNHMGSRFTADRTGMSLVLAEVKRRGLLFIDSRTSPKSVGRELARQLTVPSVARDIFLDDDPSRAAIARRLKALESIALENGYAVAIGHPYDSTMDVLAKWLPTLPVRGFVLVPASAIVRHRQDGGQR